MAEHADTAELTDRPPRRQRPSVTGVAIAAGGVVVIALGSMVGWQGYRAAEVRQAQETRNAIVAAARQGAIDLTTIDFATVDTDIKRILDASSGTFHDDFAQRAQPFIDAVKQAQSKSEGTVSAAGLQTQNGEQGQVLVAVSVKTSNAAAQEQQPRAWRMRMDVQRVGDEFKVSNVQFVP